MRAAVKEKRTKCGAGNHSTADPSHECRRVKNGIASTLRSKPVSATGILSFVSRNKSKLSVNHRPKAARRKYVPTHICNGVRNQPGAAVLIVVYSIEANVENGEMSVALRLLTR